MNDAMTRAEPAGLRVEYNHDLNVSEEFLAAYSSIRGALKDERLLERFNYFEAAAKSHKRWFHLFGLWSLILGSVPLIAAALRMIVGETVFAGIGAGYLAVELAGVISICLVLWNRRRRHRVLWCQAVFCRERLRQWHFQKFLDGPLIEKLVKGGAEYQAVLDRRWAQLEQNFHDGYGMMMEFVLDPSRRNNFFYEPADYSDPNVAQTVLDALETLRVQHQLRFSRRKVEVEGEFAGSSLSERTTRSETIASVTLAGAVLVSTFSVIISAAHLMHWLQWDYAQTTRWLSGTALLLAVISATSRAYRAGFTLPDESESYEEYCGRIRELQAVFKTITDDKEKLRQLEHLEEESAAELRRFLRMKTRATFLF